MTQHTASASGNPFARSHDFNLPAPERAGPDSVREALKRAVAPAFIEDEELDALAQIAARHSFAAKVPILRLNRHAGAAWLLAHGQASIGYWDEQQTWHQTRTVRSGAWLDVCSAWLRGPYLESAVAATDAVVYEFPATRVEDVCTQHPRLYRLILASMAERVKHETQAKRDLASKDVLGRLAGWILSSASPSPEGPHVVLAQRKNLLASELSTSPETLSRSLARLRTLGCIATRGYRIDILDEQRLRETARNMESLS